MPLEKIETGNDRSWARWKIEEQEEELARLIEPVEIISNDITNPLKRLEWMAGRAVVKLLIEQAGFAFQGVAKDQYGKPSPIGTKFHLALSHSYPYVAALLDKHKEAGIDLEQPKPKLLNIAARVLHKNEIVDAGDNLRKHCIYWCAKETLVKIHGKKDLIFAENLRIDPFKLAMEGSLIGRIIVDNLETAIPLAYMVEDNFVMVISS